MKKIILISIAVAALSTTADARTHHRHAVMGAGVSPALLNANASDHAMYMRNISRDFPYDSTDITRTNAARDGE